MARSLLAAVVAAVASCGPGSDVVDASSAGSGEVSTDGGTGGDPTATRADAASSEASGADDSGESSTSDGESSDAGPDADSTTGDSECPDVHRGSLTIVDDTDVDALRFTRRVEGDLVIQEYSGPDLTFLGCLQSVGGGLAIQNTPNLADLTGLERLSEIGGSLGVVFNLQLTSLSGLGAVQLAGGLWVAANPSLAALDAPQISGVTSLVLGDCVYEYSALLDNPLLESLDGLSGLTSAAEVIIGSQSLTSLDRLHEIAAADPSAIGATTINANPNLPHEEVELLQSLAGGTSHSSCLNFGEPAGNACYCPRAG